MTAATLPALSPITFIGGGNMAQALIAGLRKQGAAADSIRVVEPLASTRQLLIDQLGVHALPQANDSLGDTQLVVWAIKPQLFQAVAQPLKDLFPQALHLSVAAGIRSDSITQWLETERVVRAMPNTPALVGLGQTGLYARGAVSAEQRQQVEALLQAVGQSIWVSSEDLLDAVTAVSGSGPAYVFYVIEAMVAAGVRMGLTPAQAHQLAVGTMVGAAELARASSEAPAVLRERVTSKGGTTHAAISSLQADGLPALFEKAMVAARDRAVSLGDELGSA
jgi:pyrroline-5-carboxylate reductase